MSMPNCDSIQERLTRIEERLEHISSDVTWMREHVVGFAEAEGRLRAIGALGGWVAGIFGGITVALVAHMIRCVL